MSQFPQGLQRVPALLYGVLLFLAGSTVYLFVSFTDVIFWLTGAGWLNAAWKQPVQDTAALLVWGGIGLSAFDLFVLLPYKRPPDSSEVIHPVPRELTVALTAYNDEPSIGQAVRDFLTHPAVRRVLVVDNNSVDHTAREAAAAGAEVIHESRQGYGHCVHRALTEAAAYDDTALTLLCEGDMTFRAYDIDKFLAYAGHAEIVNGTRIVEQLRARHTQLTTFMYYGNFFVGKLLEAKHIGQGTLTDVGTTYKLCWNVALRKLLPLLIPEVNLEFNAHFLDTALAHRFRVLECPITFHNRVGISKGGNVSNRRALQVGLRMMKGIILGWAR